jgi:acyl-coenzyme A thioesterase PaaI-like protein
MDASEEPGFDPARFLSDERRVGHATMLGIRYLRHGKKWIELSMPFSLQSLDEDGEVAFGPVATLLDMATGFSIWVRGSAFRPHATLDLRIDRLRDPQPGRMLIGRGECLGLAGDVAFVRGIAHDGDLADPIALAAGSFMMTERWG